MAIIVNTNYSSLVTQRNLSNATDSLNTALQRMSTGYKVNSAKDDAAGMYIATNMETQIRGSKVAKSNVANGSNLLQVAEGDLGVIESNLQRIRDLAVQASNGVYSTESMDAMKDEVTARAAEITRIATSSKFNDLELLSGNDLTGGLRLQVGANSETAQNALTIDASIFAAADADTIGLDDSAITDAFKTATAAAAFIATVDTALAGINGRKASIGAYQNRLESAKTSLVTNIENSSAAKSTIMDADIAEESSAYTKAQILQQTSAALLTQANQMPSLALQLIS